ncbi:MAG TPA: Ig-like domain-containing protein, partial [Candidatus Manganitrophaceae bacterium]|nr:Ig-like domain-containing protein [Candidatus Manganitrophaceae bacterium]
MSFKFLSGKGFAGSRTALFALIAVMVFIPHFAGCGGGQGNAPSAPPGSPPVGTPPLPGLPLPGGGAVSQARSTPPAAPPPIDLKRVPAGEEPTITEVAPRPEATGIDPKGAISASFDKPMDPSTINAATFLLTGPGQSAVPGSVAYNGATQSALFTPAVGLSPAATYTATLTRGMRDAKGEAMAAEFPWRFTTAPPAPICPEGTRNPYIAFDTPTTATLAWKCAPDGVAEWGVAPNLTFRFEEHASGNKHFVTFTGLAPDTLYRYRVTAGGLPLQEGTFRTAKAAQDNRFTFVVFGDSGIGSPEQAALASRMEKINPDLAFVAGDVIYEAGYDPEFDPRYFLPYQRLIDHLPFYPVVGNHDITADAGATFMSNFFHPDGRLYYDFHWGNTHFIALDSNDPSDPAQLAWLDQTLAQSQAGWKIAYFHHPPYNSGFFGDAFKNVREAFVPLFEKYHVDVVFTGHAHDYERTCPILADRCVANGITYIVTGGGGAPLTGAPAGGWFTVHAQNV